MKAVAHFPERGVSSTTGGFCPASRTGVTLKGGFRTEGNTLRSNRLRRILLLAFSPVLVTSLFGQVVRTSDKPEGVADPMSCVLELTMPRLYRLVGTADTGTVYVTLGEGGRVSRLHYDATFKALGGEFNTLFKDTAHYAPRCAAKRWHSSSNMHR
jgi:hypothetical protein